MSYPIRKKGSKAKRKKLQVYVDIDEFSACLKVTPSIRHKVAFLLAWGSGLRLSEVINVQKNDFNFKNNQLIVVNGKNSKDRIVPIPKGFKKEHIEHIPFTFDKRSLQKAFKRACINSGLIELKINKYVMQVIEDHMDKNTINFAVKFWADEAQGRINANILDAYRRKLAKSKEEEKEKDIKEMIFALQSLTEKGTNGEEILEEWKRKYIK